MLLHTPHTSFAQFSFLGRPLFTVFISLRSAVPLIFLFIHIQPDIFSHAHWLTLDRQTVVDVTRLHINEEAIPNKQWAGCRRFPLPRPTRFARAQLIFPSPFPFLAPATQARYIRQAFVRKPSSESSDS